jgi:CRISPR-associated endonuclease/helicase Cas3
MLFSCLVDADYLATERFMSPEREMHRPAAGVALAQMRIQLDDYLADMVASRVASSIDEIRGQILHACRSAATQSPGLFSLTVPTGGGKTLSSLAFALAHAEKHGLRRVICAIPFTSIIEQTADEYRKVFTPLGPKVVLEHHSNVDPDSEHETLQSRLAAENWDAPLIVTTNVQLFESLFAAQTSRCRKLHRIARSVIILDEAQTLPVGLLKPCLAVLRELVVDYGCSIVLCTATQPALGRRDKFPIGLADVREIIPEPDKLYLSMKRVEVQHVGQRTDDQLIDDFAPRPQMLCVVNTRPHAARLYGLLLAKTGDPTGTFHLSTFMCGAHRSEVFSEIHDRLKEGKPCRVVSTQLIEAGVDIDFPVVYRALAGIDSIAQAAGRCNREGKLARGEVFVFEPAAVRLVGYLRSTAESAAELIPDATDLLDPNVVRRYFELHYWKQEGDNRWDDRGVMNCFPPPIARLYFQFRAASDAFRFITEVGKPVFVPYGEKGQRLIEELRAVRPAGDGQDRGQLRPLLRRLQRYTVNIYEPVYKVMIGSDIEPLESGYDVLTNSSCYDDRLGFCANRAGFHEPDRLIY